MTKTIVLGSIITNEDFSEDCEKRTEFNLESVSNHQAKTLVITSNDTGNLKGWLKFNLNTNCFDSCTNCLLIQFVIGIMKKTDSNDQSHILQPIYPASKHPPMEIIITQPGSGGSGTSSNDSRLTLNLPRNNKIYPS